MLGWLVQVLESWCGDTRLGLGVMCARTSPWGVRRTFESAGMARTGPRTMVWRHTSWSGRDVCPDEPVGCPEDLRECWDGSYRS